jgi:hypothetical protein
MAQLDIYYAILESPVDKWFDDVGRMSEQEAF